MIGVDGFISEGRAVTNFIGNSIAAFIIAKSEKAIDMNLYKRVVEKKETGPIMETLVVELND